MPTRRFSIQPISFTDVSPEFTRFCAARDFLKADGVSILTKICHPDNQKKLTGYTTLIHICPTMISLRSDSMNGLAKTLVVLIFFVSAAVGADKPVVEAVQSRADAPLVADPSTKFWSVARPAYLEKDTQGKDVPSFRTEVRTRWTKDNLYFLFICPY